MRSYIDHHEIGSQAEFEELAFGFTEQPLGIDRDLFRGPLDVEKPDEHQARLDAARDVLADLREQAEAGDEIAAWDALYADALTAVVPLARPAKDKGRVNRKAAA
ncbi:hypothetical protein [Streptomyces natalensis]|uniref:Uncharacterized protein n=1 Tax=Streptomyces natalensis ATCC 27448 TaxID=1240678 RepID=A0A0D7CBR6_9ACTN|nr:hypothetical protein [Streptomyces natalensis]KIZ13699.1 hypothetical protein SNA_37480 [Streptomyces natalensis ATCC 27448]